MASSAHATALRISNFIRRASPLPQMVLPHHATAHWPLTTGCYGGTHARGITSLFRACYMAVVPAPTTSYVLTR